MQDNEYPTIPHTDTQLRIEALVQARHAVAGKTAEEIKEAATVFYGFLKG